MATTWNLKVKIPPPLPTLEVKKSDYPWKSVRERFLPIFSYIWRILRWPAKLFCRHLACSKLYSLEHVSKDYEVHSTHTIKLASKLKQKAQTTYEHALANTSTYGELNPLNWLSLHTWLTKSIQVHIHLQLQENMERKNIINMELWQLGRTCQHHKKEDVWFVKQPLNWLEMNTKANTCKNWPNN
jgi:hypothetical protein